ncbi:UNVERIFIED_ORG: hypothetical protein ABIC54_006347 [Burkholderia sp. 1263]
MTSSQLAISPLRQRMIDDMRMRQLVDRRIVVRRPLRTAQQVALGVLSAPPRMRSVRAT